jgi:hypothetical protein
MEWGNTSKLYDENLHLHELICLFFGNNRNAGSNPGREEEKLLASTVAIMNN